MYRTFLACAATAVATAALTAGISSGSPASSPRVKTVAVGDTAIFAGQDLLCVNESADGAPRFKTAGVACSSYAKPYNGVGVWFTTTRAIVTRPPNGKITATYRR